MHIIRARNVNDALPQGLVLLQQGGVRLPSRFGEVIEMEEPVVTHYDKPLQRVLFSPARRANPFFHFFEALWILAGRRDVAFLVRFLKKMGDFSDDGQVFHAAYGYRLRHTGGQDGVLLDQLAEAIRMLRMDPSNRRIVCTIWDPLLDLATQSKDIPCNDCFKLEARHGRLNLTVFCRSNDAIWGAYGANAVQFSSILEYAAAMTGLPVGWYEQISSNFHAYATNFSSTTQALAMEKSPQPFYDLYRGEDVHHFPMVADGEVITMEEWDHSLHLLLGIIDRELGFEELEKTGEALAGAYFTQVAFPLYWAWRLYKAGRTAEVIEFLAPSRTIDWHMAALMWMESL